MTAQEPNAISVFVLSVTNDIGDPVGAELADRVTSAGFTLVGRDLCLPDRDAVDAALSRRLADPAVRVVIVAGGVDLPADDAASRAVYRRLHRRLPGFGEAWRALALPTLGPATLLSAVVGGVTSDRRALFALPGDEPGALLAAERLVLPLLPVLMARLEARGAGLADPASLDLPTAEDAGSEFPDAPAGLGGLPDDEDETEVGPPPGLSIVPFPDAERPPNPELATGWEAGLRTHGGTLLRSWPELPELFERLAPAREVLDQAGQRAVVTLQDGRRYAIFGYPDLNRVGSKALLIRDNDPFPEVVALHRHPRKVGMLVEGGLVGSPDQDADRLSEQLTGRPAPEGELFAIEGDAVYLRRGSKIVRWDGKRESDEGSPNQCFSRLLLRWSQR